MDTIEVSQQGDISIAYLNYNEQNRFDLKLLEALDQQLDTFAEDDSVKTVIFTGKEQKFFSNGLNVRWMVQQSPEEQQAFFIKMHHLMHKTFLFPKPLIGCINGHNFGLGAIWSCAFDFRLMNGEKGWTCFPEIDVGVLIPESMMAIIEYLLPTHHYNRVVLTGQRITGPEAVSIGLAESAHPPEELMDQCIQFAQHLASKNLQIYASLKERMRREVAKKILDIPPLKTHAQPPIHKG